MKWLFTIFAFVGIAYGQTTNVSFTITDGDGQTWNGGKFIVTFLPTPGNPGPYLYQGHQMTAAEKGPYNGVMDGTGTGTVTLPSNNFITPSGTKWQFVLAPNASAASSTVTSAVTGASQDLSSSFSSQVQAPRFPALGTGSFGYLDGEVTPIPNPGGSYFNVTSKAVRVWDGTMWFSLSNSASTVTAVTATTPLQSSGGTTPDISFQNAAANTVAAGPTSGPPGAVTMRALTPSDVPSSILFPLLAPNGSLGAPSYSWANETNAGFYRAGAGDFVLAMNGRNSIDFVDGIVEVPSDGSYCFSVSTNADDGCGGTLTYDNGTGLLTILGTLGTLSDVKIHGLQIDGNATATDAIDFISATAPNYLIQAPESSTPSNPAATFEKQYFKASKGVCSVDSSGTERCVQKTGTSPIVVSGDAISCPTCLTTSGFTQIATASGTGCNTGGGSNSACKDTLTWSSAFADTNYVPVCMGMTPNAFNGQSTTNQNPVPTIDSITTTTITVTTQTSRSLAAQYDKIFCIGIHP